MEFKMAIVNGFMDRKIISGRSKNDEYAYSQQCKTAKLTVKLVITALVYDNMTDAARKTFSSHLFTAYRDYGVNGYQNTTFLYYSLKVCHKRHTKNIGTSVT